MNWGIWKLSENRRRRPLPHPAPTRHPRTHFITGHGPCAGEPIFKFHCHPTIPLCRCHSSPSLPSCSSTPTKSSSLCRDHQLSHRSCCKQAICAVTMLSLSCATLTAATFRTHLSPRTMLSLAGLAGVRFLRTERGKGVVFFFVSSYPPRALNGQGRRASLALLV
jgi:hypothetical protein